MAVLELLSEEPIGEESFGEYVDALFRVVCVSERLGQGEEDGAVVRTTYLVDWEQLVHLLEHYSGLDEDIVEVKALSGEEARIYLGPLGRSTGIARA